VTLEDLRQLIVAGERIKVVDDKSGEDLTRSVLLQIIAEQEQFGMPVLGLDLLEMIIRFYGGPMQALLSRSLEQAFTAMLRQQQAMQSEMAKALQAPFAPLTEFARKNMEMWEQMQAATRSAFTGAGARAGTAGAAGMAGTAGMGGAPGTAGAPDTSGSAGGDGADMPADGTAATGPQKGAGSSAAAGRKADKTESAPKPKRGK
jgi:polyhydroxyalkanoate synthesis repressor PhaR